MDNLPPTPPAIIQSDYQEAMDIRERIVSAQSWLVRQQPFLPPLTDTPQQADREPMLSTVHAFWEIPATNGVTRRAQLIAMYASAMIDTARIRQLDGSLDDATLSLIRSVAIASGTPSPHIQVHEVTLGDAVHAGTLLAFDDRDPHRVVAFSVRRGWDVFDNLQNARHQIEQQIRRTLAWQAELPGLSRKDTDGPESLSHMDSRPLIGHPAEALATRLIAVQQQKIQHAWLEFALEQALPDRDAHLAERIDRALDLGAFFDANAILAIREGLLHQVVAEARLAKLPSDDIAAFRNVDGVRAEWQRATAEYAQVHRAFVARRVSAGLEAVPSLQDYAIDMLGSALLALGVTEDPRHIQVTLDRTNDPFGRLDSLRSFFEGPEPHHTSLPELAFANVPPPGIGRFSAKGADGHLIRTLDDTTLRALIRGLDLHTRYLALVDDEALTGPNGILRRQTAINLLSARMRFDAVDARVSGYIDALEGRPSHGLSQRGWLWVQAVLDSPEATGRRKVYDMDIAARQVTYHGVPVQGVIEVAVRALPSFYPDELMASRVYYTPGAPDGIVFREFRNEQEAQRQFFRHPDFSEYLVGRLPAAFSEVPANGTVRRFISNTRRDWIFGSNDPDGYVPTEVPFTSRDVAGNILEATYLSDVELTIRNTRDATRSTAQADAQQLVQLIHLRPTEQLAAHSLLGLASAPFHIAPAAWRAYDHIRDGNYVDAFVHGAEAYGEALGGYAVRSAALGGLARRPSLVHFRDRRGSLTGQLMPSADVPASSVSARSQLQGVYRVDEQMAMAVDGKLYLAHYDISTATVSADLGRPLHSKAQHAAMRFHHARWHAPRALPSRGDATPSVQTTPATGGQRDLSLYREYLAELEVEFPNAVERQAVIHQMDRELVGLPTQRSITPEQRIRVRKAWARAEQTLRGAEATHPPLRGRFLSLTPASAPERLWFYGHRPLYKSAFVQAGSLRGGTVDPWAALIGEAQGRGIVGVRVTDVPPHAISASIADGSTLRHFDRTIGFAVELRVRDLLGESTAGRGIELLEVAGNAHQYILRARSGGLLELHGQQFRLLDSLPEPSSPFRWTGIEQAP